MQTKYLKSSYKFESKVKFISLLNDFMLFFFFVEPISISKTKQK